VGLSSVKPAVEALLAGVIDYAGLFPPAGLGMSDAVHRFARYRGGPDAWLLGRFVVSAARLDELDAALAELGLRTPVVRPWQVSAIVGGNVEADAAAILRFNSRQARDARAASVDAVEMKATGKADIARLVKVLPRPSAIWLELNVDQSLEEMLGVLGGLMAGAKLRTGGVTPEAFPSSANVACFLLACARAGVRWKATAGLHHAFRGLYRLTSDLDCASAVLHGFLNVFLAALVANHFVQEGASRSTAEAAVVAALEEPDAQAFHWEDDAVLWRSHRFGQEEIRGVRERSARSFGCCSFEEPVDDLRSCGLIAAVSRV
jgi:hypothetical protein